MSRTDDQLAMLDDSARYYGWGVTPWITTPHNRTYHQGKRAIYLSCYPTKGLAGVRIITWEGHQLSPTRDLVGEVMTELASNTPPETT